MRMYLSLIFIGVFLLMPMNGYTQNAKARDVNVQALSEDQIKEVIAEIEKRGLSESDAMALGKAKGLTQDQIDQLRKRIGDIKSGNSDSRISHRASGFSDSELGIHNGGDGISEKVEIEKQKLDTRIFGVSLFNNKNLTFEPSISMPVPDSYLLGPGDHLHVDIWGSSQQSYHLIIDRNGSVNIPLVGPIYVGGLNLDVAKSQILSKLSSIYSDLRSNTPKTFASVRTGQLKTIKVNVVGEVFTPGTYTMPGTASLFNALYLSGGPNKLGSFRDVQLIRGGRIIANLDVYDFLINGNAAINVALMDNDVVMVPTYANRVKIQGQFKRTGIFEAKNNETVSDMVRFAGGFEALANKSRIEMYRSGEIEMEYRDIRQEELASVSIKNGDSLFVGKILERYSNKVNIVGAVFNPGNYEYSEGLTLSSLINKANGLKENAFLTRGTISRLKSNYTPENISFNVLDVIEGSEDFDLKPNDAVFITYIDDMSEKPTVAIWGEVQNMGVFQYGENITLGDLILLAGGFSEAGSQSSIEVMRRLTYDDADKSAEKTSQLFQFSLTRDLTISDDGSAFVLKPFDEVFVRRMPGYRENNVVTLLGQVMYSGNYGLASRAERISDVIARAGGLTSYAYPEGAKLIRKYELSKEDKAIRNELMLKDTSLRFSSLNFETVSIDLEKILDNPGSREDIYLEHGDEIRIPAMLQTVKVSGEVLNPSSTVFTRGLTGKQYIHRSGGFSINAKKGKTYVLYPNGSSAITRSYFLFRNYPDVIPGAEIVVPQRPERNKLSAQAWVGIAAVMTSMSLTIVTIANSLK